MPITMSLAALRSARVARGDRECTRATSTPTRGSATVRGMRRKRRRSCRYLPPARTHALGRATESQLVQPVLSQAMQREKRPQAVSALVHCAAVHAALPEIPRSVAVRSAHARCRPTHSDRANQFKSVHIIGSRWIVCLADVKYLRTSSIGERRGGRRAQGDAFPAASVSRA